VFRGSNISSFPVFSYRLSLPSPVALHILDTLQLGRPGIIAATALETSDGVALFDTGAESTFGNVIAALGKLGIAPEDIRHVFLSHIHFDHAGAAFHFAHAGAKIYVHPRGAEHLIDPTRLVESATRIFGADMERLWGRIGPVPSESVRILEDGNIVRLPPFTVKAVATPGHASHHHVYHWDDNLFGGDIAGVRIGKGPPIPPFVPPELHVESWLQSIAKMRTLKPANLYLPHFGKVKGSVADHFDALEERVSRWSEWLRDQIRAGLDEQQLRVKFSEYEHADLGAGGATEEDIRDYETADPSYMAIPAAIRYWKKYHPEEVPAA
jgi:glyoxylase-like metal-dependent hydrolase (beta-lactamase superfamily II)